MFRVNRMTVSIKERTHKMSSLKPGSIKEWLLAIPVIGGTLLAIGGALSAILLAMSTPFAWLTHCIYCFSVEMWGALIAGAIFFPIGILHGWYLWFKWLFL